MSPWFRRHEHQPTLPGMPRPSGKCGGCGQPMPERGKPHDHSERRNLRVVAEPVSRRGFLTGTFAWVGAAIAGAVAVPGAVMVGWPAFRENEGDWAPIARLDDPGPDDADLSVEGVPVLTSFKAVKGDAYVKPQLQNIPVFVLKRGGEFTVYDVRCTHLGCPVSYDGEKKEFLSPCHGAVFDIDGRVTAGPPPRPLDRYEVKIEDGVLYAGAMYTVNDKLQRA